MRKTCVAFVLCCLAISPVMLRADALDPGMTIDAGDPPPPTDLSVGVDFTPNASDQAQAFDYINNLNGIVTSFTLTTDVAPNFTGPLTCQEPSSYFKDCSVSYVTETIGSSMVGVLTYKFFGVNPPDGDERCSNSNPSCEAGEQEGIPINGVFHFELTGWTDATGLYTQSNPPVPVIGTFTLTPEPSTFYSAGIGFLVLVGMAGYRRRKAAAARVR